MSKTIQVGLIGYGIGGQLFHAPFIHNVPELKLAKIRTTKEKDIAIARARYPEAEIVSDAKDIFQDSAIDLVVITTPNTTHLPLAKEALLAGKHVVVDKPFTITSADADELIALASSQNRLLSVFHNRRFDSDFKTVEKVINSRMLGRLAEYEVHYDRFRNFLKEGAWREEDTPGSGILYDLGAHLIDQVQTLFGLPEAVYADLRMQRQGSKTVDNFEVILHYPDLKVTMKAGMLVKEPGPHFMLYGTQGSFIKYGMDVQEEALKAGYAPADLPDWGVEPETIWGRINTEHQGMHLTGNIASEKGDYTDFYRNIYQAILGEAPLLVTPQQARNTIRIIELAIKSQEEQCVQRFM